MNEKRAAWFAAFWTGLCIQRSSCVLTPFNNQRTSDGEDDEKSID
jgi:hypothetical protein